VFLEESAYKVSEIVTAATEATRRLGYNIQLKGTDVVCPLTLYQPVRANAIMASNKNLYGGFNTRHCT